MDPADIRKSYGPMLVEIETREPLRPESHISEVVRTAVLEMARDVEELDPASHRLFMTMASALANYYRGQTR